MVETAPAPERQALRSRIKAYWRVVFAIVGLLDCSCFCYCYYYHHDFFGDSNAVATVKNKRQSRSKSSKREQKQEESQHRRRTKKYKPGDDASTDANVQTFNASAPTQSHELPWWGLFQKERVLSSVVWQSMAFHHHPIRDKNSTSGAAAADSNSGDRKTGTTPPPENKTYHAFLFLHLGFGMLCGIEMILRAKEARRVVLENKAIAAFEELIASTVAKANQKRLSMAQAGQFLYNSPRQTIGTTALSILSSPLATGEIKPDLYVPSLTYSSTTDSTATTVHLHDHGPAKNESDADDDQNIKDRDQRDNENDQDRGHDRDNSDTGLNDEAANKRSIILFLRSTFGLWLPIGGTCLFWLSLLPFKAYYRIIQVFFNNYFCWNTDNDGDGSLGDVEFTEFNQFCEIDCGHSDGHGATAAWYLTTLGDDTAWATLWLTNFVVRWTRTCEKIEEFMMTAVWKRYILGDKKRFLLGDFFRNEAQKKLHEILLDHKELHALLFDRPKLIWFRLGRILNIVKLVRFAGPLARMVLKLQDQLIAGYLTFWKARSSRTNRERRLQRPSMMLRDLRRLESIHKVETTIASWPSQCSVLLETLSKEAAQYSAYTATLSPGVATAYAEDFLRKSRERGKQITSQIEWLRKQFQKGVTEFTSTEIHDRILGLSKDLSRRNLFSVYNRRETESQTDIDSPVKSPRSRRSSKKRWYDFLYLENLLSSRDYLISPRSRFSVVWRITVTNCLVSKILKLSVYDKAFSRKELCLTFFQIVISFIHTPSSFHSFWN